MIKIESTRSTRTVYIYIYIYIYLGKAITVAGETDSQVIDMLETCTDILRKIVPCPLPLPFNIEALQFIAMSRIDQNLVNTNISEEHLLKFDRALIKTTKTAWWSWY